MVKYKILWEALKETAETLTEQGFDDLSWHRLLKLMKEGEETVKPEKLYNGTVLIIILEALEFGCACLGVIVTVLCVMGRLAYVG